MTEYKRMNPLEDQEKYGVVCHSMIIAALTASGHDPTHPKGLANYTWLSNCQLLPYKY
jgi:hypothetical protein